MSLSDLTSYLVEYRFRILARECRPSDLPETICSRLSVPLELDAVAEESETGARTYVVKATVEAESGERAVEIIHRFFIHLPGLAVLRFGGVCLDQSRNEKPFESSEETRELFPAQAESMKNDIVKGIVGKWGVDLKFKISAGDVEPNQFMANVGLVPFTVCNLEDGMLTLHHQVALVQYEGEPDAAAENRAWAYLEERLKPISWAKVGATVFILRD